MTLEGSVYFVLSGGVFDEERDELRIAIFWSGGSVGEGEQAVATRASFPADYTLDLLKPPPEAAIIDMPWARGARVAVGTPVLYIDVDGDERWSAVDTLAGGNSALGVVHVDDDAPADLGLATGYQRASTGSPLCDATSGSPLSPPDSPSTPLYTSTPWNVFTDWDCDGELHEWQHLCPSESELAGFCELGGTGGSGLLTWCVEQVCQEGG